MILWVKVSPNHEPAAAGKILFVDDDPNLLTAFQCSLRGRFPSDVASCGSEALDVIARTGPFTVAVVDMNMPGMSGIELLEKIAVATPDTIRLMLTGDAERQTAIDAVNRGKVFRFISKPCPPETLMPTIEAALRQHELQRAEKELLEGTLTGSVRVLTDVLGMVAPEALGRGQRLRDLVREFARWASLPNAWELEMGALLSPLGYASLPSTVLRKIASGLELTPAETAIAVRTPEVAHGMLAGIPRMAGVADIVLYQDQHFNGTGFPGGRSGEDIPYGARLIKVLRGRLLLEADGVVKKAAHAAMTKDPGVYDAALVDKCFECFATFLASSLSAERPVLQLPVKSLIAGHILVSDIVAPEGIVLVGAGHVLSPMMLERLRNHSALGEVREPVLVQEPAPDRPPAV